VSVGKVVRAALGVVVVVVLGFVVLNWWNDYKSAPTSSPSAPVAAPAAGTSTVPTETVGGVAVVKIDGVNFRTKPSSSAKLIRGLKKGESVTVILKDGGWYKIEDSRGKTGWVTANGDYVVLEGQ
jgi:uncharacterized protein YgiM (DUF1202 family)